MEDHQSPNSEPEWKQRLRDQFESALAELQEPPTDGSTADADQKDNKVPDIYQFYEELAALRSENRKVNRRTAEAFTQFGDSLGGLDGELQQLRRQLHAMSEPRASQSDGVPRKHCLALLEMEDRLERLGGQLAQPPAPKASFFSRPSSEWPEAWSSIRQAVQILTDHLNALLNQLGVEAMGVMAATFDPTLMKAVAREPRAGVAPGTVIEEVTRGYHYQGEPLRVAEVKVAASQD